MKKLYDKIIPDKPTIHDEILGFYLDQAEQLINKQNPEKSRDLFMRAVDPDFDVYKIQAECSTPHDGQVIFLADVVKTLCYSQRITYRSNLFHKLYLESSNMSVEKLLDISARVKELLDNVEIPFEESSICVKATDDSEGILFNIYENADKRIKNGVEEKMYTVKVMTKSEPFDNSMGFRQNFRILAEFSFIKSMFPRLIFFVNSSQTCMECYNKLEFLNEVNLSRVLNPDSKMPSDTLIHCLKSPRVYKQCNKSLILSNGNTRTSEAFMILLEIMNVFKKIQGRPKKLNKISRSKKANIGEEKEAMKNIVRGCDTDYSPFGVINITEGKEIFEFRSHKGSKHSVHSSPCEHPRSGHTRRLKSGKIIHVSPCIINKGKRMSIINIKD